MNPCTNTVIQKTTDAFGKIIETPVASDVPSIGCIAGIVSNIVGKAFLFLGLVTIVFLFVGAIQFIISRGDPKGIEKAQKTMTYAIIGAVVVMGSFILVEIVLKALSLPDILTGFTLYQP